MNAKSNYLESLISRVKNGEILTESESVQLQQGLIKKMEAIEAGKCPAGHAKYGTATAEIKRAFIPIDREVAEHYASLIPAKVVQDYNCHWYVIPAQLVHEFSKMLEMADEDDYEKFNEKFSQYRTGGDLNNTQLYMKAETPADVFAEFPSKELISGIGKLLAGAEIFTEERAAIQRHLFDITAPMAPKNPSALEMVEEFHQAFGCPVLKTPVIPDMMGFPHRILISELETILEKMKALNDRSRVALRAKLILEEFIELYTSLFKGDIVRALDGLSDLLYVTYGTHHEIGTAPIAKEAFAEVHRSNMSKLGTDGKPVMREDGKILKGPNYTPPDLAGIITKFACAECPEQIDESCCTHLKQINKMIREYPGLSGKADNGPVEKIEINIKPMPIMGEIVGEISFKPTLGQDIPVLNEGLKDLPEPTNHGIVYADLRQDPPKHKE